MRFGYLPGDENCLHDVVSGYYERQYTIKADDVVVDVGAHMGFFSHRAATAVGPHGCVVSIEPEPRNFRILKRQLDEFDNCTLINAAAVAWGHLPTGPAFLHLNPKNSGGHSLFKNDQSGEAVEVKTVKLSTLLESLSLSPDFIKIDTEGAERMVIADLLENGFKPTAWAIETHSDELYSRCRELLEGKGYEFLPKERHIGVCYANLK